MARFHDGESWTDVLPEKEDPVEPKKRRNPLSFLRRRSSSSSANKKDKAPVAPAVDGDGSILVTIPSFRDGKHCGEAVLDLFKKAESPDNIVVSLVEQQLEKETYCLEAYCKAAANVDIYTREEFDTDRFSVNVNKAGMRDCPRIDQIRVVRVHEGSAKGPPWARALGRRSIGNEEFCMHVSTQSIFSSHWDTKARKDWLAAKNEFAILSNPPKPQGVQSKGTTVPRICAVNFLDEEKLPYYEKHPDGKVELLEKPLLSHTWSPGMSFGKCHMEEAAPSDGFLPYVSSDIEAFARYARMWTRGYDVYTPTDNLVFHKVVTKNPNKMDWIENWRGRKSIALAESLRRIRSYLGIFGIADDEATMEKVDNLGIYGIGKRRTLQELNAFVGIDLTSRESRSHKIPCGNFEWVPYDSNISPMENLYSNPDDLDPQPEFPLRTNLTFSGDGYYNYDGASFSMIDQLEEDLLHPWSSSSSSKGKVASPLDPAHVPYGTILVLWILGLMYWCRLHVFSHHHGSDRNRRKNKSK